MIKRNIGYHGGSKQKKDLFVIVLRKIHAIIFPFSILFTKNKKVKNFFWLNSNLGEFLEKRFVCILELFSKILIASITF
jgi:hypothetical protein